MTTTSTTIINKNGSTDVGVHRINGAQKWSNGVYNFDGHNDYGVVQPSEDFQLSSGSIELCFNADDTSGRQGLISRDSSGFDGGGHVTMYLDGNTLKVRLQSDTASYEVKAYNIHAHTDYNVEFKFGDGGMKLIINGQVVDTNSYTGGLTGNNEPIVVGANQWTSGDGVANNIGNYFNGQIKELSITGEKEAANTAPTFDNLPGNGILYVNENETDVKNVDSTDAEGDNVTYSIVGGRDKDFFTIDPQTGLLSFKEARDFENPVSGGNNNVYDVTIRVTDEGGKSTTKALWVKVQDVNEPIPVASCEEVVIAHEDFENGATGWSNNKTEYDNDFSKFLGRFGGHDKVEKTFDVPTDSESICLSFDFYEFDSWDNEYMCVFIDGNPIDLRWFSHGGNEGNRSGEKHGVEWEMTSGSVSNKAFSGWSDQKHTITMEIPASYAADGQLTVGFMSMTNQSISDESFGIDNVKLVAKVPCADCVEEIEIACDDFQNGASGWSHGRVTHEAGYGSYLGSFGGHETTQKTFDVPADADTIKVTFDFLEIDSWDGEKFFVYVDGHKVDLGSFRVSNDEGTRSGESNGISWTTSSKGGPDFLLGNSWNKWFKDQIHEVTLEIPADKISGDQLTLKFDSTTNQSRSDESFGIDNVKIFSVKPLDKIDFNELATGETVEDQFDGVTITAQRAGDSATSENDAMIFDSDNPTGGDGDLGFIGQGKILIISEDNDAGDPDDNAHGGTITFDFDNPSMVSDITVLDIEGGENGGSIKLFDASGALIKEVPIPVTGNNGRANVSLDAEGVSQMVVMLNGSGAIDDICYKPGEPAPVGSLSGRYFLDKDRDGLDDDADNAVAGVTVELLDAAGNGTGVTTTTDADGNYSFTGLVPGSYGVKFTDTVTGQVLTTQNVGGDDAIDSDAADIGGNMSVINGITVVAGQNTPDNDAGVVEELASLAGRYFCDENRNDVDDNEPGVEGATVWLLKNGQVIASTTTAADGSYEFLDLVPGSGYAVRFEDPADVAGAEGKRFVDGNVGGDDTVDSDVASVGGAGNGNTGTITLAPGEDKKDVDAGIEEIPGSLSGRYFCDTDNDNDDNGNGGEPAVAGKTVTLFNADGTPVTDADGNTVAATTTDTNGGYSFGNLVPGDYYVVFEDSAAENKRFVDQNSGASDASDSDVDGTGRSDTVTVNAGQNTPDVDAGVEDEPGAIAGRYFCDEDDDDADDGIGVEAAVVGATVILLTATGAPALDYDGNPVAATTTDTDGNYSFTNLAPGDYVVQFQDPATIGAGDKTFVAKDAVPGNDADDSDADATTGRTDPVTVTAGNTTGDVDAGIETSNTPPETVDDAAELCEGTMKEINVLDNDPADADGDTVTVIEIKDADETASVGDSITLSNGTVVTLLDGAGNVKIDASGVAEDLIDLNEISSDEFQYTVTDGTDTAMGTVDVDVKGSRDTGEEVSNYLDMVVDTATIDIDFTTANGPLERLVTVDATINEIDGTYLGFCIDEDNRDIVFDPQTADLYGTDGAVPAGTVDLEDRLDNVTWILNQDFSAEFTANPFGFYSQLQEAIWWVIEDDREERDAAGNETGVPLDFNNADAVVQQIVNDALTIGEGFEADEAGELYGVVLVPDNGSQAFIVGVPWEQLEEECVCPMDGGGAPGGGFL